MPDDAIEREHWSRQSIAGIVIQAIVASRSGKGMALPAGRAADEILTLLAPAFASQQAPEGWRPIGDVEPGRGYMGAFKSPLRTDGRYEIIGPGRVTEDHGYSDYLGPWQAIKLVYKLPAPSPPAMLDAAPSVTLGEVG